jgi:hypothetical protein
MAVPLAAPLIRKRHGITGPASVEDGLQAAQQALDFVAERGSAELAQPSDSPMAGPRPSGAAFAALLQRFEAHPGIAWTRQLYTRHRGASRDFDGPSGGSG